MNEQIRTDADAARVMEDIRRHYNEGRRIQCESRRLELLIAQYAAAAHPDAFPEEGGSWECGPGGITAVKCVADGPLVLEVDVDDQITDGILDEDTRRCVHCGCTEDEPCITLDGPCGWAGEDVCTACILAERVERGG